MEFIERTADGPQPISIARCRELLGGEAESMTDQEVALIRRHAETMACIVVESTKRVARFPSRRRASETHLARAGPNYTARTDWHSCSGSGGFPSSASIWVRPLRGDGLRAVISMPTAPPAPR
jgi:hypothetical protein